MIKILPFILAALSFSVGMAWAHSTVESSIPADGATVSAPKEVSLTFTKTVRLVTLKVSGQGVDETLAVDRSAPAGRSFSVPLPALGPGKYQVKWTASARDGHIMKGSFSFTVAPAKP